MRLQALGHKAMGIKPDPIARLLAQTRATGVYDGTAEELPNLVTSTSFDAIMMIEFLEHCLHPLRALENAARLLRPGGKLFLEVCNCNALGLQLAKAAWPRLDVPRHLSFFTALSLRRSCEMVHLVPGPVQYRGFRRQVDREWLKTEQRILNVFQARQLGPWSTKVGVEMRAWWLLARSLFAPRVRKYDSLRVVATRY